VGKLQWYRLPTWILDSRLDGFLRYATPETTSSQGSQGDKSNERERGCGWYKGSNPTRTYECLDHFPQKKEITKKL